MRFSIKKMVLTAMFIAVGMVLPSVFHLFGSGAVFLPMHIPVLIAGFVCGGPYGAICGFLLPYLSSVFTGMPPLYPVAVSMSLELCTYGALTGYFFRDRGLSLYPSLLTAMMCGRLVSGVANAVLLGMAGRPYGLTAFLTAAFVTGLPGIIIQLILVPAVVAVLLKANLIRQTDRVSQT